MIVYCVGVFLFYLRCLSFKRHSIDKSSSPSVCDKHLHCFHCTSEVTFSMRLETHLNLGISGVKFRQGQVSDPIRLLCISTLSKNSLRCLKCHCFLNFRCSWRALRQHGDVWLTLLPLSKLQLISLQQAGGETRTVKEAKEKQHELKF